MRSQAEIKELDRINLTNILEVNQSINDIVEYIDLKSHHMLPNDFTNAELIQYIQDKYFCNFFWKEGAMRILE